MQITIHNPNNLPTIDYRKLEPLQGNLKDLKASQYEKLYRVLEKRGFTAPVFLWYHDAMDTYFLMDGHQRQRVMTKEDMNDNGSYEVPYILIEAADTKDAMAQLLEITSQYGKITQEGFDEFLAVAELPELETLELVNFDALPELNVKEEDEEVIEDEAPEVDESEPPKSKLGEVYQLGRHRLMCGSATEASDVATLMDGQKADMVFTDPPYGVSYQSNMRDKSQKFDVLENDDSFLSEWIPLLATYSQGFVFIWTSWKVLKQWLIITEDSLGEPNNIVIWNKGGGGIGDLKKTFSSDYEVALVFHRGNELTGKRIGSVWDIGKDNASSYAHPTQKPVALAAQAINSTTRKGDIVLDLFGGSGSTLIACEQTDRTCQMMELDPKYVDVIRKRYWKFMNNGNEEGWEENTPAITKEQI